MLIDRLRYFIARKDEHCLHSPFLFDFYNSVINNSENFEPLQEIEILKRNYKSSNQVIRISDFGAGSKFNSGNLRKVSSIAKYAHRSTKWASILSNTARKIDSKVILELGTSLGLTTSYLSKANPHAKIYTLEGCPETLKIAKSSFKELEIHNVVPLLGNIDEVLPQILKQLTQIDFALFDANHRYQPTLNYFNKCLSLASENSCFVFDDIYWSTGMKKAWKEICEHPKVSISLDFFKVGMVFFRKNIPKQHFILKA